MEVATERASAGNFHSIIWFLIFDFNSIIWFLNFDFNSIIWFWISILLFYFWSFSLCNFVDPPRAALRGICPNRSHIVQLMTEDPESGPLSFASRPLLDLKLCLSVDPDFHLSLDMNLRLLWDLDLCLLLNPDPQFCCIHPFVRYHIHGRNSLEAKKSANKKRKRNCKFTRSGMLMNSSLWFGRQTWACPTIKDSQGEAKSGQFGDH